MFYTGYRLYKALKICFKYSKNVFYHAFTSKETATFTYNLTPENEIYLMNLTAQIVNADIGLVENYCNELKQNDKLKETILHYIHKSPFRKKKDNRCDYGNKVALYAMIRILKPKTVVENGVEVGFTSIILCEALRRNISEGNMGKFIGLDIDQDAGFLVNVVPDYKSFSEIKCGDAIESLKLIDGKVDFYFSDGFRSYQYERNEFDSLDQKITNTAIVISNKATFSKALFESSQKLNRRFAFFKEQPLGHWYEGAGLGIMY